MSNHILPSLRRLQADPKVVSLDSAIQSPNIFNILRLQRAEIRHSNFLCWMLDPDGSHALGEAFLRQFLLEVLGQHKPDWIVELRNEQLDRKCVGIMREAENIDLLLETQNFVVVIENKIDTSDHDNQLSRYRERVERKFRKKHRAFIYLTPYGTSPEEIGEKPHWLTLSYADIARLIERMLEDKHPQDRVGVYISDYLAMLRREIMADDEANRLARQIYHEHKRAIDFVISQISSDRGGVFKRIIEKEEWHYLEPSQRGFSRFLPRTLVDVVPKTGSDANWNNLAFVLEFYYDRRIVRFAAGIAPGDEHNRQVLRNALEKISPGPRKGDSKYLVFFVKQIEYDVYAAVSESDIEVRIDAELDEIRRVVSEIECTILKVRDQLNYDCH